MTKRNLRVCAKVLSVVAVVLAFLFPLVSDANADITAVANATSCSGTPPGGTICSNGSGGFAGTGGSPFSLTGLENGSFSLPAVIGTQTSPVYELNNDTGHSSFTIVFNGSLASNQFLTCQENGGFAGKSCSITGPGGTVGTGGQYGPPAQLPARITFTGIGAGDFDLTFSSFGNGASGAVTGVVPEPASMLLFGTGLVALGAKCRRRKSGNPVAA